VVPSADQIKHLEMIQGVINRMGQNSFAIKGWAVTLLAAAFALAMASTSPAPGAVATGAAVAFWWMDAFFLDQERRFRGLYDKVRRMAPRVWAQEPFSMVTQAGGGWTRAAFSRTLLCFYGALVVLALGLAFRRLGG
jgi:hypothetical protein